MVYNFTTLVKKEKKINILIVNFKGGGGENRNIKVCGKKSLANEKF